MELQLEYKDGFHYACFVGVFDLSEAKNLSLQVLEGCCHKGVLKILFDVRELSGRLSTAQRYEYAIFLAAKNFELFRTQSLDLSKIAYLGHDSIVDPGRFGETVAVNRGTNVKAFTDYDQAVQWLGVEQSLHGEDTAAG